MNSKVILCVEDNMQVQMFNKPLLESKGYAVKLAVTLREARDVIAQEMPDLIILDIHLPDGNGLDFLRELRKTSKVPVIALTNSKEEQDIIEGLTSGCDDYIPKPHTFPVLYARIEARLRAVEQMPETITKGNLTIKFLPNRVFVDGQKLQLPQIGFNLLLLFVQNENKCLNPRYIYEKVWGSNIHDDNRALKVRISEVRKKLEAAECEYTISNMRGEGYCFQRSVTF